MDWFVWAVIFGSFGIFCLGTYNGESNKVIEDRRNNRVRMINGADSTWFFVGIMLVGFSIVLALMGHKHARETDETRRQIRSQFTSTEVER